MLHLTFLKKIRHRSILGAILGITVLTAGLFLPLMPALAYFNPTLSPSGWARLNEKVFMRIDTSQVLVYELWIGGQFIITSSYPPNHFRCGEGIICEFIFANGNTIAGDPVVEGLKVRIGQDGIKQTMIFSDNRIPINFPDNFIASILAYAGRFFSDLYILIALAIGLPLAFWIIKKIINLWKKEDLEDRRRRTFADRDFEYKRKNYHWKGD